MKRTCVETKIFVPPSVRQPTNGNRTGEQRRCAQRPNINRTEEDDRKNEHRAEQKKNSSAQTRRFFVSDYCANLLGGFLIFRHLYWSAPARVRSKREKSFDYKSILNPAEVFRLLALVFADLRRRTPTNLLKNHQTKLSPQSDK